MILICHNKDGEKVFDDGDKWVWVNSGYKKTAETPKKKSPFFPLFAVLKWQFTVDNKNAIAELEKNYKKEKTY
ncbi:MAG: hypothetical protein J6T10_25365 [Methanobrevibacter sp.]|nr:hypothetical protein [Methanobrevibacter sp.]